MALVVDATKIVYARRSGFARSGRPGIGYGRAGRALLDLASVESVPSA